MLWLVPLIRQLRPFGSIPLVAVSASCTVGLLALVLFLIPGTADGRTPTRASPPKKDKSASSKSSSTTSSVFATQELCKRGIPSKAKPTKTSSGLLCLEGTLGQWFPRDSALRLLKDVKRGKAALALQPKLEHRLELEKRRTLLLELDGKTLEKIAETWRKAAEEQARARSTLMKWYHSPYLWMAVGFVAGTAATVGIVAAIGEIRK